MHQKHVASGALVSVGREPWMHTQFGIVRPLRREQSPIASMFAEAVTEADAQFIAESTAHGAGPAGR
jgi:hypothetical protein